MKIEVKKVTKKFKDNNVLSDVSMTLEDGKIYGFTGRNGSGKSVLMKILCGFYMPTSGEVLFDGQNLSAQQKFPESMRALIEKPSFLPEKTGFENLKLLANIQKKIGVVEIEKSLADVNLFAEKDKKYRHYSLGMKQKLGFAQVIMEDPQIMLFDEPFNGIEEETVKKLKDFLKGERDRGKIIVISSHIKEDIIDLTDTVFEFDQGKVKQK